MRANEVALVITELEIGKEKNKLTDQQILQAS